MRRAVAFVQEAESTSRDPRWPAAMRFAAILMALLAVAVALFSFRFVAAVEGVWINVDPGIRGVVVAHPFEALTHGLVARVALRLGPFQFLTGIRRQ